MQAKRHRYPTLFNIVLDILPIPASAVKSEEAFSQARRTTTWERSRLSPDTIKDLQLLKHFFQAIGQRESRNLWVYSEHIMDDIACLPDNVNLTELQLDEI